MPPVEAATRRSGRCRPSRTLPLEPFGGHIAGAALVCLAAAAALAQVPARDSLELPSQDSLEVAWWRESMKGREQRLSWWREARFGMFVHWGVYSTLGNEYAGRKGGTYAEHVQRVLKIPIPEYRAKVAGVFKPTEFDADEWIRTAGEAGMGYFVITAKHHDGFALWPTAVNDYDVVDATPWKRDPLRELRDACRKHGVKFGFYYSHAFDWGEEDGPGNDWDYGNPGGDLLIGGRDWWTTTPEFLPKARRYVDRKAIPQLRELIRGYDPDILWFDTPHKLPPSENLRILEAVRKASPRVVINGRLVRGWGDYESTADRPAEFAPHDGDWEGIPTTNESYGWSKFDDSHKPAGHFIQLIAKASARGGNLLMNIGPRGDGRFDPKDVAILRGIGAWWRANGESVRGTSRTRLPVQVWGESTRKDDTLYLHVFAWPKDGRLVVGGLRSDVKSARLLGSASSNARSLPLRRLNPLDVAIQVGAAAPDAADSVLALDCRGPLVTDLARLLQPAFPVDTLRAFDAELQGSLRFGPGKKTDAHVLNWTKRDDAVFWHVRLNEAARFEVAAVYDAEPASAGGAFVVTLGPHTLRGVVEPGRSRSTSVGIVALEPGSFEIKVGAAEIRGGELMRLRALTLRSVPN
jgi:alpha-L-fucosidase